MGKETFDDEETKEAAGTETVNLHSGYVYDSIPAYMEARDNQVNFFIRNLPQGRHTLRYRVRAEFPGSFSALPARIQAMYTPEIKSNSNEMKIIIKENQ